MDDGSQIDHILIRRRDMTSIEDIRSYRDANIADEQLRIKYRQDTEEDK